jgi:uncharacterized membrane protein
MACLVGALAAASPDLHPILRVILVGPLVLFLPGLSVSLIAFRGRLGPAERAVYSVGLSLALVAFVGLALAATPWHLTPGGWAVGLGALVTIPTLAALVSDPGNSGPKRIGARSRVEVRRSDVGLFAAGAGLLILAVLLATRGAADSPQTTFTELWILPSPADGRYEVELGVRNSEAIRMRFRVELSHGANLVAQWTDIDLRPGETWRTTINVEPRVAGGEQLDATLFTGSSRTPARHVVLWWQGNA